MNTIRVAALAWVAAASLQGGVALAQEGNNIALVEVPAGTGVYHTHTWLPPAATAAASPSKAAAPAPEQVAFAVDIERTGVTRR